MDQDLFSSTMVQRGQVSCIVSCITRSELVLNWQDGLMSLQALCAYWHFSLSWLAVRIQAMEITLHSTGK